MSSLKKNVLEWSVFAIGLVLTLGALAYLTYEAATRGSEPPTLELKLGTAERRAGKYVLPVRVVNHGNTTAEQVLIEVRLERGDGEPERSQITIAYVPRRSERKGWVTFESDPSTAEKVTARALGYEEP